MRKPLLVFAVTLLVVGVAAAQAPPQTPPPDASAVVDQMMTAMGGPNGWEHARYLRFDWVVEREGKPVANVHHLWDRYQGRYRVEWEARDGNKIAVLFNLNTREGKVFVNGQPAGPDDQKKYLEAAYGRFINDSYWLLMPWKLKDPGVILEYAGETELEAQTYDLVHVHFEQVGLTPGDHYWAFINRSTHMMERWAYFLEGYRKDKGDPALEKATPWAWSGWMETGGIRLARDRQMVGQNARIYFPVLAVLDSVEDAVFESLDTPMPGPTPGSL